MCQLFIGCYIEISTSGTGLHIIGRGTAPTGHGTRNNQYGLEFYTTGRYCALTGTGAVGSFDHPAQQQVDWLLASYFPAVVVAPSLESSGALPNTPSPEYTGPADDEALITLMLGARINPFGSKASLPVLWAGGDAAYDCYGGDKSATDAALCQSLSFWTGRNAERVDRLFRRSGLMREKWDRYDGQWGSYGRRTILKETTRTKAIYTAGTANRPAPLIDPETGETLPDGYKLGSQLMTVQEQITYFAGCTYVQSTHCIFTPRGDMLDQGRFRASWGGHNFVIGTDNMKSTKSAWEAVTESQGYTFPKAQDVCFRPEATPGALIQEEGRTLLNTYMPVTTERKTGDPARFLDHLSRILPDPGDREILLAYCAAIVQYPGKKFQWAPLLVGMEGNGKSLFTRCIARAVGFKFSHIPNAADLANKFNAWLEGKLFIGIEEIYTSDKAELIERLKPMITDSRIEIQAKGGNQYTGDNRANFILCSNHKDAIRVTGRDRRYCIFYTAQQEEGDLERDGMNGQYFPSLYRWLDDEGYAVVNDYLRSYQIPDALNPSTECHRAPTTSSTAEAIRSNMGTIEQEVMEAVEEGRVGFCGGWISSVALSKLLEERHLATRMPKNKREDMLMRIGFIRHPSLVNGRTNSIVPMDGGVKPVLYVRRGSLQTQLTGGGEIVKRYVEAQQGSTWVGVSAVQQINS